MIIIFIIIAIILIIIIMGQNNREYFINDYYSLDWNDPNMVTGVNEIGVLNKNNCKNCMYSMSCDFSNDSHPWCYKSHDIPEHIYNTQEHINKSKLKFHSF